MVFILVELHKFCLKEEERSRVGTSSFGYCIDLFDQVFMFDRLSILDSNFSCPLEFEMIFTLEVHGLQFFIRSLVNNASYLQTFVFGLMLMQN